LTFRVVEEDSYGAALQYFTGSKGHNIHLRGIAKAKGLKINEYGVFKGKKKIAGKEEKEIYRSLGMSWIEPNFAKTGERSKRRRKGVFLNWSRNPKSRETFMSTPNGATVPLRLKRLPKLLRREVINMWRSAITRSP